MSENKLFVITQVNPDITAWEHHRRHKVTVCTATVVASTRDKALKLFFSHPKHDVHPLGDRKISYVTDYVPSGEERVLLIQCMEYEL